MDGFDAISLIVILFWLLVLVIIVYAAFRFAGLKNGNIKANQNSALAKKLLIGVVAITMLAALYMFYQAMYPNF